MKFGFFVFCAMAGLVTTSLADTDAEVNARKTALDLAGAFTNDGFRLRDGYWTGTIKPDAPALIAVNLYTGNHYWFSAGAADPARKLGVEVYDETGTPVAADRYNDGDKAAAGVAPTHSGQYFVSIQLVEGEEANVCLAYSYK